MFKNRSILILLIVSALIALTFASCGMKEMVTKEMLIGTWVLEEGPKDNTKLIITPEKIQVARYTYTNYQKTDVSEVYMSKPADWTLNADGSVDFSYSTGVIWPCEFKNHIELSEDFSTLNRKEEFWDQGYKFKYKYELIKESDEYELEPGWEKLYEQYGCSEFSYYDYGFAQTVDDSCLRLYYDGTFQWDRLGSGTYEVDLAAKRVVLHQTESAEYWSDFGNMTLEITEYGSYKELYYLSSDEWPFYSEYGEGWFKNFRYQLAF